MAKKIRFAPLVRVSTEDQKRKKDSLIKQKEQIEEAVKALGGKLIKNPWKFSGQEHSTQDAEREKLDALLGDSTKGHFDAIMVADESRWSRDNLKSEQGLKVFRDNKIRFYALTREYDLFNETQAYMLRQFVNLNTLVGLQGARKSMEIRIQRARDGKFVSGSYPFARIYDKANNTWAIDGVKQEKLKIASKMYLDGESLKSISNKVGIHKDNLRQIFKKHSGDKYFQSFHSDKLNIHVDDIPPITIPRLLPDATIKKLKAKIEANKINHHAHRKHEYLLGRMVICDRCGYAHFGETKHKGKNQYYRHSRDKDKEAIVGCKDFRTQVPAHLLEGAIFNEIYFLFGDKSKREEALRKANNSDKNDKHRAGITKLGKELTTIERKQQNLVQGVAEGKLPGEKIKPMMDKLLGQEEFIKDEILKLESKIENSLTSGQIKELANAMTPMKGGKVRPDLDEMDGQIKHSYLGSQAHLSEMTFQEKRDLLKALFPGKDPNGMRYGIYIKRGVKGWHYRVYGVFNPFKGYIDNGNKDAKVTGASTWKETP